VSDPATTAPTEPTAHRSNHDDYAQIEVCRSRPPRSAGHALSLAPARLSTMNGPGGWLIQLGELSEAIPVSHLEAVARLLDGYDPG